MAGNNFQGLGTHAPLKALPSATLRSAPVRTFNGRDKLRHSVAFTVGQLSAPPPEAVTLQADQRTNNKTIVSSALSMPYLRERTSPAVINLFPFTPANF
jgi:hypothetical protein